MNKEETNTVNENEREYTNTPKTNHQTERNKMTANFICVLWPRCVGSQRAFKIGWCAAGVCVLNVKSSAVQHKC